MAKSLKLIRKSDPDWKWEPPRDGSIYGGYLREDAGCEDGVEAEVDDEREPGLRLRPAYRAPEVFDESPSELWRLFRG